MSVRTDLCHPEGRMHWAISGPPCFFIIIFYKKCHCGTHTYRAQKWMHILKTVLGWLSHVLMSSNISLCNKQSTLLITISTLELCVMHYKNIEKYIYIYIFIIYIYNIIFFSMHLSIEMWAFWLFITIFFFNIGICFELSISLMHWARNMQLPQN